MHKLIDYFEEFYGAQVCISKYSDRILFFHCYDELVKKYFLRVFDCMFRGHVVYFFDWIPNCNEVDLKYPIPSSL